MNKCDCGFAERLFKQLKLVSAGVRAADWYQTITQSAVTQTTKEMVFSGFWQNFVSFISDCLNIKEAAVWLIIRDAFKRCNVSVNTVLNKCCCKNRARSSQNIKYIEYKVPSQ